MQVTKYTLRSRRALSRKRKKNKLNNNKNKRNKQHLDKKDLEAFTIWIADGEDFISTKCSEILENIHSEYLN